MTQAISENVADAPFYWFICLEQAVNDGEHEAAAKATRELRRLGVEVKYKAAAIAATDDHCRPARPRKATPNPVTAVAG